MNTQIASWDDVHADWAWTEFSPTAESPWDLRKAAHLFRRAGFSEDLAQLEAATQSAPAAIVDAMMASNLNAQDADATAESLANSVIASGDASRLSAAWVYRLQHTPNQVKEKATLFWHGHFATGAEKVQDARRMWRQNQLLRQHALGSFRELVHEIARDPAMLIYLDSASNRKTHPNENFARELMELFCLGEGNYTERDVQELARCFTGWEIKNGNFRKNRYQQDRGEKQVLGQSGAFDGEEAIDIVLAQDDMAHFICDKLVRFYVADDARLSPSQLKPLADCFRASDLEIAPVLTKIFKSNVFFSNLSIARKIRSPVELCVGLLRSFQATTNTIELANGLKNIGQGLFYPPNVKGWDGGRAWINSSTLLGRVNLLTSLLNHENTRYAGKSLVDYLQEQKVTSTDDLVRFFERSLLAIPLTESSRNEIVARVEDAKTDNASRWNQCLHALIAVPNFQLG